MNWLEANSYKATWTVLMMMVLVFVRLFFG